MVHCGNAAPGPASARHHRREARRAVRAYVRAPGARRHVAPGRSQAAPPRDEGTRLLGDGLRALLLQLRLPE